MTSARIRPLPKNGTNDIPKNPLVSKNNLTLSLVFPTISKFSMIRSEFCRPPTFAFCYLIEGKAIYLLVSVQLAKSLLCGLFTVKKKVASPKQIQPSYMDFRLRRMRNKLFLQEVSQPYQPGWLGSCLIQRPIILSLCFIYGKAGWPVGCSPNLSYMSYFKKGCLRNTQSVHNPRYEQ